MFAYMNEFNILLPEIFLSIIACALLLLGVCSNYGKTQYNNFIFALVFAVAAYLLLSKTPSTEEIFIFDNLFKMNSTIKLFKLIVLVSAFFFILLAKDKLQTKPEDDNNSSFYEFPTIVTLAVIGMLLMLSANNFLSLYVSIELQSLSLYVLAAYERNNGQSSEAGLKYFILGSFASGLLLFGISLIYGFTGNLDFVSLKLLLQDNATSSLALGVIVGIIMVLIGLFFKVSAAPFHMWTPDVYQGAPTIVTSFFATVAKVASVGVLFGLTDNIFMPWKLELQPIFTLIICISVLVGAIGALKQDNLKRLLAYSSIGHVGFILLAVSSFGNIEASKSVLLYLIIYVFMTLGTFAVIMNLARDNNAVIKLQDLAGLSKQHPLIAMALSIFMFSLAGIPPFAGFFAKFYAFKVAIDGENYIAVAVSVVAAVIAAYYYLKIVKIMYFDETQSRIDNNMNFISKAILLLFSLFNLGYVFIG